MKNNHQFYLHQQYHRPRSWKLKIMLNHDSKILAKWKYWICTHNMRIKSRRQMQPPTPASGRLSNPFWFLTSSTDDLILLLTSFSWLGLKYKQKYILHRTTKSYVKTLTGPYVNRFKILGGINSRSREWKTIHNT